MVELVTKSSEGALLDSPGSVKFNVLASRIGSAVQVHALLCAVHSPVTDLIPLQAETNYLVLEKHHSQNSASKQEQFWALAELEKKKARSGELKKLVHRAKQDPDWGQRIHAKV